MDTNRDERCQQSNGQSAIVGQAAKELKTLLATIILQKARRTQEEQEPVASSQRGRPALLHAWELHFDKPAAFPDLVDRAATSGQHGQDKQEIGNQADSAGFGGNIDIVIMRLPQRIYKDRHIIVRVSIWIIANAHAQQGMRLIHTKPGDPVCQALGSREVLRSGIEERDPRQTKKVIDLIEEIERNRT